jgi:hypothetical protein
MIPEGYKLVLVKAKEFDALISVLERADRKGYMPDAMIDEWNAFDWREYTKDEE